MLRRPIHRRQRRQAVVSQASSQRSSGVGAAPWFPGPSPGRSGGIDRLSRGGGVGGHGDVAFTGSGATTTPRLLDQQQRERNGPRAACVEATGERGIGRRESVAIGLGRRPCAVQRSAGPRRSTRASASRADTSDHHVSGDRGTESRSRTRHPPSAHPRSSTSPAADRARTFAAAPSGATIGEALVTKRSIARPLGGGHRRTSRRAHAARVPPAAALGEERVLRRYRRYGQQPDSRSAIPDSRLPIPA